jgi:hypothetical protein
MLCAPLLVRQVREPLGKLLQTSVRFLHNVLEHIAEGHELQARQGAWLHGQDFTLLRSACRLVIRPLSCD